jgi:hypothetical protein
MQCFLEAREMKTLAILLVVGVAGYALYDLFKGNATLSMFGTQPGNITRTGVSTPGVPIYSTAGTQVSNAAATVLDVATAATDYQDAFGPSGNQVSSSETPLGTGNTNPFGVSHDDVLSYADASDY